MITNSIEQIRTGFYSKVIALIALFSITLVSCNDDDVEEMMATESIVALSAG
ncbi:MAG: hypothetical protein U5K54_12040 [Cytophagales bacterium]|nr:hypothetical protein [Cytophagales bacterium]